MNYSILAFFLFLFLSILMLTLTAIVAGIGVFAVSWLVNATADNVLDFLTLIRYKESVLTLPDEKDPIGQFEL